MPRLPASLSDFRGAFDFVSFAGVSDAHVEQALERGRVRVEGWIVEGDALLGQMLYAAHELTIAGLGNRADANIHAQGLADFQSIKSGGLTVSRNNQSGTNNLGQRDNNPLMQTQFGRRYLGLARHNILGIRVVGESNR